MSISTEVYEVQVAIGRKWNTEYVCREYEDAAAVVSALNHDGETARVNTVEYLED